MNDLIQKMGREIFSCQDSLTRLRSRRHSRSWFYKNVNHVLSENTGINRTEDIMVTLRVPDKTLSAKVSSPRNPQYAVFGVMLAISAVLTCIWELIYKGKKERVELRRWRTLWWFYYPRPQRRLFGDVLDIFGLLGAISQCICSTVQYVYFIRHHQNPLKASLLPAIFLICLGASRLSCIQTDKTDEQNA
ncbi:uncharacterized protein LOC18768873 isoform X2 [Prunus persica]|uniref:uncharacterized protein LOC18768873 isoform X2 n=1 Tax=Prunus persica TaxID=3760 RepID=UPI0009AB8655|nr:uncharacterized protein LOC18768873 isoform X2 [Prunus persica]